MRIGAAHGPGVLDLIQPSAAASIAIVGRAVAARPEREIFRLVKLAMTDRRLFPHRL